jgi:ABC-type spermidine/putrescine transport system permease subunit II
MALIGSITALVSALLGFLASFILEKNRRKQSRIDAIFEKRMKIFEQL